MVLRMVRNLGRRNRDREVAGSSLTDGTVDRGPG